MPDVLLARSSRGSIVISDAGSQRELHQMHGPYWENLSGQTFRNARNLNDGIPYEAKLPRGDLHLGQVFVTARNQMRRCLSAQSAALF